MHDDTSDTGSRWQRIDRAAFGIIYGTILVLSILIGVAEHPSPPFETAILLFGSVLAITLAKTFAEMVSHALDTGERITRAARRQAWQHSRPTLAVANLPTLLFIGSGFGWIAADLALLLSQIFCVAILTTLGARVGWVLEQRVFPAILGAFVSGGIGLALAVFKYVWH